MSMAFDELERQQGAARRRKAILTTIVVVLIVVGLLASNEYIRTHRKIHVVNGTGEAVRISIDGGPPDAIEGGVGTVSVAEGPHKVRLFGAVEDVVDLTIEAGYFDRWFKKPAWVVNPGGEAVLVEKTVVYAVNPVPGAGGGSARAIVGESSTVLPNVDYLFEEPPQKISMKGGGTVTKTALVREFLTELQVFEELEAAASPRAAAYIERRLKRVGSGPLFDAYLNRLTPETIPRAVELLKSGLDRRPVDVMWHRTYQSLAQLNGKAGELLAYYDGLLKAAPDDAALIYLRGRVEPDWTKRSAMYRRSNEVAPGSPWGWMALGGIAAAQGKWDEALAMDAKAVERKVPETLIARPMHLARLGLGRTDALIAEYRAAIQAKPFDVPVIFLLFDALVAGGRGATIASEIDRLTAGLPADVPAPVRVQFATILKANGFYRAGKLAECIKACEEQPRLRSSTLMAQAMAASGRAVEASKDTTLEAAWQDPWTVLAESVGLAIEGRVQEAAQWRSRAAVGLMARDPDSSRLAAYLTAAAPPSPADLAAASGVDPKDKALLLVALAQKFPAGAAGYLADAKKLMVSPEPPSALIRRATEVRK